MTNIQLNTTRWRRPEEMANLQNINNRLARYIYRVRNLETENERLVNIELPDAHKLLGESIRERQKLENLVNHLRNQLVEKDQKHARELDEIRAQHAINLEQQEIEMGIHSDEALHTVEGELYTSNLKIDQLEQMNSALIARNDDLQTMFHFESQRSAGSQCEINRLQEELASQMNKYQDLMDDHVTLDSAIAAYDNILRVEEQRLNI